MSDPMIPDQDSTALAWMEAFSNVLNANLSAYQLQAPDGAATAAAVNS